MTEMEGPVAVIGAGLLGTSVGLALRAHDVEVVLSDVDEENLRTASGLGAGKPGSWQDARLVIVAVPPDHLGTTIAAVLLGSSAVVTDVGSVKAAPLAEVTEQVPPEALARYVGGHPMAGRVHGKKGVTL